MPLIVWGRRVSNVLLARNRSTGRDEEDMKGPKFG